VAGIAAHVATLSSARDHFELVIRSGYQAPRAGCSNRPRATDASGLLVDDPHPAEQARDRAMTRPPRPTSARSR
jgi:hypothetical protein